jgi:hypothetical protein
VVDPELLERAFEQEDLRARDRGQRPGAEQRDDRSEQKSGGDRSAHRCARVTPGLA